MPKFQLKKIQKRDLISLDQKKGAKNRRLAKKKIRKFKLSMKFDSILSEFKRRY